MMKIKTILVIIIITMMTAKAQQGDEKVSFKADTIRDDSGEITSIKLTRIKKEEPPKAPVEKVEEKKKETEDSDFEIINLEPEKEEKVPKKPKEQKEPTEPPIREEKYKAPQKVKEAKAPEKDEQKAELETESEETIKITDVEEKPVKKTIPVKKVKVVRQSSPLEKVTTLPGIKGDVIIDDTIFDEFNRISEILFNKVTYKEMIVKGHPKIFIKKTPFITQYSYQDDVFNTLGDFHISVGAVGMSLGVGWMIWGIYHTRKPGAAILSGVAIILGGVEIAIGVKCIKHRRKFWKMYNANPVKETKRNTAKTGT
jgi:hypothetical protein